jgi:type IV secretory pathway VirB4 component
MSDNKKNTGGKQNQGRDLTTQNSLPFAEVRDGIVIMNDGSFRAIVRAESINFDLMSSAEQESVEYSYQSFLNSLYFQTQIFIKSRKIDMRPYLERLSKIRTEMDNMLLGMLMEDYIYFISDLVEQTNIMSKEFYIIVPYYADESLQKTLEQTKSAFANLMNKDGKKGPVVINEQDLEKAKTELKNRVQNVVNGLLQVGINSAPLSTQELIQLLYNTYNPDTATRQTLGGDISNLQAPVISKGEGSVVQSHLIRESDK